MIRHSGGRAQGRAVVFPFLVGRPRGAAALTSQEDWTWLGDSLAECYWRR